MPLKRGIIPYKTDQETTLIRSLAFPFIYTLIKANPDFIIGQNIVL